MCKSNWRLGQLNSNWKFGHPSARTSRQVFGYDVEFDGHRKSDTFVFWVCVALAAVLVVIEIARVLQ